ncbi:MAG: N-acetyl-alpha-D-glucosaminyl L-malate synthase BshA [Myxococcales bacterium]|nr:N-acetyl-alpha-D-glucosaminyl L-malate synthase BshA [Myxococcales bacterium]
MKLRIGIACYPTFGGSGVVATEIGLGMARRGHCVHFICTDVPRRLDRRVDNIFFHQVRARDYPVFPGVPYSLALASAMASVATHEGLDVLHAHYAVPHATSAWMAKEVLGNGLSVVTTLHGTDITLVGSDESYLPITRHSIVHSNAVTAPSQDLAEQTFCRFDIDREQTPIDVIPNFVDTELYRPLAGPERPRLCHLFGPAAERAPVLVHVSNFRPVKRVPQVVDIFAAVARELDAYLLLVGDGPERGRVEGQLRQAGLWERARLLGNQEHLADVLRECSLFLLPSEMESFGLAALEALSCGVPVVASRVGGLPEVVRHEQTGILVQSGDVATMAAQTVALLKDPERLVRMGVEARADVLARFRAGPTLDRYEALYARTVRDTHA